MNRLKCMSSHLLAIVDLTLNTGLCVLELGFGLPFYAEVQSFDGKLSSLPFLLSRFPKALTSIKLDIWTKNKQLRIPSGVLMAEVRNTIKIWIAINKLLSRPAFPALIKVVFTVFNHWFEMSEYLECRMAQCK